MKILSQNGLTELISKIKTWGNSTFLSKTEVEQTTVLSIDNEPTENSPNLITSGGVKTAITGKVDKVEGKGLSTEDYTTEEKAKLNGINIDEIKSDITDLQTALIGVSDLIGGDA